MVTAGSDRSYEYRGLSTDTKPVEGVDNGSTFFVIDTQEVYMFDYDNQQWVLIS